MEATAKNGRPASPEPDPDPSNDSELFYPEDFDSTCSTPFVSAPSSPGRNGPSSAGGGGGGFFYSCPASPMHFAITSSAAHRSSYDDDDDDFGGGGGSGGGGIGNGRSVTQQHGYEFEFSARFGSVGPGHTGSMSSADELFLNGQIRPMKLSTHLEKPQVLAPLLDLDEEEEEGEEEGEEGSELGNGGKKKGFHGESRGRDLRLRNKSLRRRTRSMSPLRTSSFEFADDDGDCDAGEKETRKKKTGEGKEEEEAAMDSAIDEPNSMSASSSSTSRSSSAGRNSKRWVFLKEFLYRSKSEGRSNNKFWSNISFSPSKEKKGNNNNQSSSSHGREKGSSNEGSSEKVGNNSNNGGSGRKPVNGLGRKRVPAPSPHELHYKASRAQAEEMRKKTFLPYKQGLLGCLGFSSKGYGAMNGFARALNPVSSR